MRRVVKRFLTEEFGALADRPRSGRPPTLTVADLLAVEAHLDAAAAAGETWTGRRVATWLETTRQGRVNHEYLVARLQARTVRWKRIKRSVRHQAAPDRQAQAKADLAVLTC